MWCKIKFAQKATKRRRERGKGERERGEREREKISIIKLVILIAIFRNSGLVVEQKQQIYIVELFPIINSVSSHV